MTDCGYRNHPGPPATQGIAVLCPFCGGAKPSTQENVIRSPRFYAFLRDPDDLQAGWVVLIRNGDKVEQLNGPTIDDAITAAALRISALDAAERNGEERKP